MRRRLLSLPLALCLAAASLAPAQTATLIADAHVNAAQPDVNSGTLSNLNVGNGYSALLQFDLSLLPSGLTAAQVSRAVLTLYCNRADQPGAIDLAPIAGAWGEYSVTYNTAPPFGSSIASAQVTGAGTYIAIDVTGVVQDWITTPSSNHGLALTSSSAIVQFDSKENDQTAHPATLEVQLALGAAGAPGPQGAQGPIGPPGSQGPAGPQGNPGLIGPPGPIGPAGSNGPAGAQGTQGFPGPQGPAGATGAQGPAGPAGTGAAGAQGPQGPAGPPGTTGPAGSAGSAGPSGPQGPQGPRGGDGAVGSTGAQGPTGSAGPQGLTGLTGPPGPTGAQGPQGIQGQIGPVGINFRGAWSSAIHYNVNDSVTYSSSTYLAQASSQNLEPDLYADYWTVLALGGIPGPQGPQGLTGAPGTNGAPGPQGSEGPQGPIGGQGAVGTTGAQGPTGLTGPQGLTGLTGPPGPTGAQGPQGIQGQIGPVGINFRGAWSSSLHYNVNDTVTYNNSTYLAQAASDNLEPDLYADSWTVLALGGVPGPAGAQGSQGTAGTPGTNGAQGPQGPQGPAGGQGAAGSTGAQGPTGPTGPQGPTGLTGPAGPTGSNGAQGPAGPQGAVGINFRGAWSSSLNYNVNDAVTYGGSTYLAQSVSDNLEPDLYADSWTVLAQSGTSGTAGSIGATGPQGPQGPTGTQGPQGPQGAVGINFRGAWSSSLHYNVNDAVTYNGSTYLAQAAGDNLEPDLYASFWNVLSQSGSAGPTGPAGASAVTPTIAIGAVTTGAAGTQASVTNTGSDTAAVFNFTIPQGAAGAAGSGGSSGSTTTTGIPFASTYHAVSFSSSNYAVNSSAASNSESGSVLTWVPEACTVTRFYVYSQQPNSITVTLRQGTPGSMADTAMKCSSVATNTSCSVTGSVAITADSFVDLVISGANGTPSPVWTAFGCD